jgi:hypothetical protein
MAFYRDLHGNPVPKEDAVRVEYVEYAADGRQIRRTYAERKDLQERLILKMDRRPRRPRSGP